MLGTQTALKTAIAAQLEAGFPVDLGFPDTVQLECIWISGNADGDYGYEISNGTPSEGTVGLTVRGLVTFGGDYEETFARLSTLWDAVTVGVQTLKLTDSFTALFGAWEVKEGRSEGGVRQMGFKRDIELTIW